MKDPYEILGVAKTASADEIGRPTENRPRNCTRTSIRADISGMALAANGP